MKNYNKKINSELVLNDRLLIVVLLATLFFVPLALKITQINFISPLIYDNELLNSGIKVNIFTKLKSIFLIISGILLLILLLSRMAIDKFEIKSKSIYISLGVAALGLVFSAMMSPYKSIALFGDYARQEGTITNVLYLLVFFIALTVNYSNKSLRWFGYILMPFVTINSILTTLNYFGFNTLKLEFVRQLLGISDTVKISEGSRLIASLDNINYISGVSAILIGVFLTWAVIEDRIKHKLLPFIMSILSMLILLGSTSQSGYISFLLVLLLIIGLIFYIENKKQAFLTLLSFIVVSSGLFIIFAKHSETQWNETFGIFNIQNPFFKVQESVVSPTAIQNENSKHLLNISLPQPGVSAGSGRTYIWSETISLIKSRPIFGHGMDTFAYVFPQDDPNKISGLGTDIIIVDKPHNMYLGYAYGGGIVTLLAILVLIGIGLTRTFMAIICRRLTPKSDGIIIAFFVGTIAFFFQGLFNDSIIGVSPIAWILFGVVVSNTLKQTT